MVIRKTLSLETGEGDNRGTVQIQISTDNHPSAEDTVPLIWERVLTALIVGASSLTVSEW